MLAILSAFRPASPRCRPQRSRAGLGRRLRSAALAAIAATAAAASFAQTPAAAPVTPVDRVDLSRYVGVWYEIARLPNRYQADCASDVTATYSSLSPIAIKVVNRCRRADGSEETADGVARVQDASTNAKLEVRFLPLALAWLPFAWADYWILDLAPDYSHALVGTPSRRFLWVLARSPAIDDTVVQRLLARAEAMGFETSRVVRTRHAAP